MRSGVVKPKHEGRGALDVVSDDAGPGGAGTGGVFPGGGGRSDAASAGDGADDVGIDRPERVGESRNDEQIGAVGLLERKRPDAQAAFQFGFGRG